MGANSCTGPMGRDELQAVMLGGLYSNTFTAPQVSVSAETTAMEAYQHSASVQS